MRAYRPYKHVMGVEGPSFHRHHRRDDPYREQPASQDVPGQKSAWWSAFRSKEEPKAVGPSEPQAVRHDFQRRGISPIDPSQFGLDIPVIWKSVEKTRETYGVDGEVFGVAVLTSQVADQTQAAVEIIQAFGIPASSYQGLSLDETWKQVIGPFFEGLELGMNRMKPFSIPGRLKFLLGPKHSLIIVYQDRG